MLRRLSICLTIFCLGMPGLTSAQDVPLGRAIIDLAPYSLACKLSVLKKLGWQITEDASKSVTIKSPQTCAAKGEKEMKISLPKNWPELTEEVSPSINRVVRTGNFCLFQEQYNFALEKAAKKLKRNHLYVFRPFWVSDNIRMGWLKKSWQNNHCPKRICYSPQSGKNSEAIDSLYTHLFSSDCSRGLQLVEYAATKELFGREKFQTKFSAEEIFVADWPDIETSNSFTHGQKSRKFFSEEGIAYGKAGESTFIGASGYVGSTLDESYLDDLANRNENFIIGKITAAASNSFVAHGGLSFYKKYLYEIWQLSQKVSPEELEAIENAAYWHQLSTITDIQLQQLIPRDKNRIVSDEAMEIVTKLKEPFLHETQIYVHPFGLRNFSWHIARLARINPRMPYSIAFYKDATHAEIYDRWLRSQFDECQ
jgi:hypothetical protein